MQTSYKVGRKVTDSDAEIDLVFTYFIHNMYVGIVHAYTNIIYLGITEAQAVTSFSINNCFILPQ